MRVLTAEQLAAIALQTGRAEDRVLIFQFLDAGLLDELDRMPAILVRHPLVDAWKRLPFQFLTDSP